jgi:hypothetical protein
VSFQTSIIRVGRGLRVLDRALQTSAVVLVALWVALMGGRDLGLVGGVPTWLPVLIVAALLASVAVGVWVRTRKDESEGQAHASEWSAIPQGTVTGRSIAVGGGIAAAFVAVSVVGWLRYSSAGPMTMAIIGVLGGLVLDAVLRVGRFPAVVYGGVGLSQRDLRRIWIAFLLLAFGLGVEGFSSTSFSRSEAWSERVEPRYLPEGARSWAQTEGLFFYRREVSEEINDEGLYAGSLGEEIQIPWVFLGAAMVYVFMVMAWEPRSPSASVGGPPSPLSEGQSAPRNGGRL